MRHVALTATAVAAALLAIVACEDRLPEKSLTAPDGVSFGKPVGGGACDDGRAKLIATEQGDIWAKPALDEAKSMFAPVVTLCSSDPDSAQRLMLNYIQWTIDNSDVTKLPDSSWRSPLLTHWNDVFPYVGYTGNDQPTSVPTSVFSVKGAAGVIDWDDEGEISAPQYAALTSYPQDADGDQRDHLFVLYPISANCLTGTNLQQAGPCFHFAAFPHVDPKFSPKVKVGICEPLHENEHLPLASPSLGHLDPITRITEDAGTYPLCADVASVPQGSWNNGFGDAVKRLAWLTKKALGPNVAYAVHGGLGGLGGGLSPFGAVDRRVFQESFSDESIGTTPVSASPGTWFADAKPPGSILVQSSLGERNDPLVVLDQSGGNCKNCFGLLLQGTLFTASSPASAGVYDIEWLSLQDAANMKEAVFVLRDSGGRDIARVTYAVRNNVKLIMYNDTKQTPQTATPIGNWVQHHPDSFRIRVNLDTKKTTLWFNGAEVRTDVAFVAAASNLATISADFRGIDSGIMGWDEITIERQADLDH